MSGSVFAGKVALVTGAGRGAGRMLAKELAERGMRVAANDISPVNVEEVVAQIRAAGGQANAYIHDIAKKVDVQAMINNIMDDYGQIDLLVNSANVKFTAPVLTIDEWDLHRIFEVNLIGTLLVMQSTGRVMSARRSGVIANLTCQGQNAPATFAASRAGIAALTTQTAAELEPLGIRVVEIGDENPLDRLLKACEQAWAK